jgi:phage terminase large subunit-like protein
MHKAKKAMVQLRGGMMPFPESFLAIITTQSDDAPAGVFKEDLAKARDIRDGKRMGDMLPVLYEFPAEMQKDESKPWRNPDNWPMVTPNLGRSIALSALIKACDDEEANGEAALRTWASQHLNVEIGLAMHADRWVGSEYWERNGRPELTSLDALLQRCEVVVCGIDGGGLDDLLGFCALGREVGTRKLLAYHRAWAHRIVLTRRKEIKQQLLDLQAAGELVIVDAPGEDIRELADIICRIEAEGLLAEKAAIGVDTAGIGDVVSELTSPERGIALERIIGIPQGYKLNGAIKTTERKLASGDFLHGDTGLMEFCVGNAKIETHGNADLVTKAASGKAKIDPLMATFNCVSLMALDPEPRKKKFQFFFV